MIFKAKYLTAPGSAHVYLRVFSAPAEGQTFAALGSLTVRWTEFEALRAAMPGVTFEDDGLRDDTPVSLRPNP